MKRLILFAAACSIITNAYSQNITGKIVDEQNVPLSYANVVLLSLPDSAFVSGTISGENGEFSVSRHVEKGSSQCLKISSIGYRTLILDVQKDKVGTIVLKEESTMLKGIVVNGERPLVKAEKGALTYDVEAMAEKSTISNAYESITRLPGVMEQNEKLTLMGAGGVTVILNGKPSSMTNEQLMNLLKNTPVSNVKKAEIMYNAPAKYRVRGTVINIELKRQKSEEAFVRGEIGGNFTQGEYARGNGNMNLSFVGKKITADMLYSADYTKIKTAYDFISHHTLNGKLYEVEQYNKGSKRNLTHNIRTSLDYQIAENDNLNMAYTAAITPSIKSLETSRGNLSESINAKTGNQQMHNFNLDYSSHWGMNVGLDYTCFSYPSMQDFTNKNGNTGQDFLVNSKQRINRWNVYAGQTHTLANDWSMNYGVNFSFADEKSSQAYSPQDGKDMSGLNSDTDLDERTYNFYGGFEKSLGENLSFSLSVAGEYYKLADYTRWAVYPSMQLSYMPSASHAFLFSFSSDKAYPDYWEMQDITSYLNGYTKLVGNPNLRPSTDYTANFTYVLKNKYMFDLYYTHVKDLFAQLAYQSPDELSMIYQSVNYNYEQNFGISVIIPFSVGSFWNSRISLDGSYFKDVCHDYHDISFEKTAWRGLAMMNNTFKLASNPAISLELNGMYVTSSIQGIYDLSSIWKVDAGLKWTSANKKAELRLKVNDVFDSAIPDATVNYKGQHFEMNQHADSRYFSMSFTYKFGGFKSKEHKEVDTSRFGY